MSPRSLEVPAQPPGGGGSGRGSPPRRCCSRSGCGSSGPTVLLLRHRRRSAGRLPRARVGGVPSTGAAGWGGRARVRRRREASVRVTVVAAPAGVEARTGGDGRFRLEVEEGSTVRLEAHHSDLGFASAEVRAPAVDVQLRLEPRRARGAGPLERHPVAGAQVTVRQRGGESLIVPRRSLHRRERHDALPRAARRLAGGRGALPRHRGANGVELERTWAPCPRSACSFRSWCGPGDRGDRSGVPVGGALVGVEEAEGLPATSGRDGTFMLKRLRTGRDSRLDGPDARPRPGQAGDGARGTERRQAGGAAIASSSAAGWSVPGGAPLRSSPSIGRPFEADDGRFAVPLESHDGRSRSASRPREWRAARCSRVRRSRSWGTSCSSPLRSCAAGSPWAASRWRTPR